MRYKYNPEMTALDWVLIVIAFVILGIGILAGELWDKIRTLWKQA